MQYQIPHLARIREDSLSRAWPGSSIGAIQTYIKPNPTVVRDITYSIFGLKEPYTNTRLPVHFLAAYTHRFAYAFAQAKNKDGNAAFAVECSDASKDWVNHGKKLGLSSRVAGAESIIVAPNTLFVGGFEPIPIQYNLSGYIAMIKALTHARGYLEFSGGFSDPGKIKKSEIRDGKSNVRVALFLYKAKGLDYETKTGSVRALLTTPKSKELASFDLATINWVNEHPYADLEQLVSTIGNEEKTIGALERIDGVCRLEPFGYDLESRDIIRFPKLFFE